MSRLNELLEYWSTWNSSRTCQEGAGDQAAREIAQLAIAEITRLTDTNFNELQSLLSSKALAHLDKLVKMQGFGDNRRQVAARFIWDGIHRLIESGRLPERYIGGD